MKPSRRSYDNFIKNFTPLKSKCVDLIHKVYHIKLIPEPNRPKRANSIMGRDKNAWCAYYRLRGHHTEDCHKLKKEIEIIIQRSWLLSYMKEKK